MVQWLISSINYYLHGGRASIIQNLSIQGSSLSLQNISETKSLKWSYCKPSVLCKRVTECFSSMSCRSIAILNQAELTFSELPFIIFSSLLRLSFPALIFNGNIGPVFAGTRSSSSAHSARFLWTSKRIAPPQPPWYWEIICPLLSQIPTSLVEEVSKWLHIINKSHSIQGLLWQTINTFCNFMLLWDENVYLHQPSADQYYQRPDRQHTCTQFEP